MTKLFLLSGSYVIVIQKSIALKSGKIQFKKIL